MIQILCETSAKLLVTALILISSTTSYVYGTIDDAATNSIAYVPNNEDNWNYWWSYSGISGPSYWGLMNLEWHVCDKGRHQSPIDVATKELIYDPHMGPLQVDYNLVNGLLYNDGHAIVFNGSLSLLPPINQIKTSASIQLNTSHTKSRRQVASLDPSESLRVEPLVNELAFVVGSDELDKSGLVGGLKQDTNDQLQLDELADQEDTSNGQAQPNDPRYQEGFNEDSLAKPQFTGANLNYPYKFEALYLRFGQSSKLGSEHRINSKAFAGELQILAFNSHLYKSFTQASSKPHGLLAIAVFIEELDPSSGAKTTAGVQLSGELERLMSKVVDVKYRGASSMVSNLNLSALLPEMGAFVAYEGSLTFPGCHESVNWLILNRPLYLGPASFKILRSLSADEESGQQSGTLIADNIRPVQPTNNRLIRTNIRPDKSLERAGSCKRLWTKYDYH